MMMMRMMTMTMMMMMAMMMTMMMMMLKQRVLIQRIHDDDGSNRRLKWTEMDLLTLYFSKKL